ncbi:MAG: MFS transporter [Pseudomonadales bacterium]
MSFALPFSPLMNTTFRRLFAAQVTSLFGAGLTTIALALLAYDMAGDQAGAVLGTALALKMLAYVIFAPMGAALTAKWPRRALMVGLDLLRAAIVLLLPWVSELWHIYTLIFILSLCSAIFTPTFQALIPDVVEGDTEYTRALALSRLAYDLENILSPAIAAVLLLVVSYSDFFSANAVTFAVSALLLLAGRLPARKAQQVPRSFTERLVEGVQVFARTPRLRALLAINLCLAAVVAMQIVNTVVYVRAELGLGEQALAWVYTGLGVGAVAGALLVPGIVERTGERRVMLIAAPALAVLLALGCAGPSLALLIALYVALGAAGALVQTPVGAVLKRSCAQEQRPALFAAQFSLSHAGFLLCYPLAGWLSARYGVQFSYLAMAGLALIAALGAWLLWPGDDSRALQHTHPAQHHAHWHSHADGHHCDHSHAEDPGEAPHYHPHYHPQVAHKHDFVIDYHHSEWPK